MAMMTRRFVPLASILCLVFMFTDTLRAQSSGNVFHVWIARDPKVTAARQVLDVRYRFDTTHAHSLAGYVARFTFDSNLVRVLDIVTDSTASQSMMTTPKRTPPEAGLVALGTTEIDLSNPVLFRIVVQLDQRLKDTAWLHWDRNVTMIEPVNGVDSVIEEDGFVSFNADQPSAHVVLADPINADVVGASDGYHPDSVAFELPLDGIINRSAGYKGGSITFSYDSAKVLVRGVHSDTSMLRIASRQPGKVTLYYGSIPPAGVLDLNSFATVPPVHLGMLDMVGLVGVDTVTTELHSVHFTPSLPTDCVGNTTFLSTPIRLCGRYKAPGGVSVNTASQGRTLEIFPDPARERMTIRPQGYEDGTSLTIAVYDILGHVVFRSNATETTWDIPTGLARGVYQVLCTDSDQRSSIRRTVIVGP